MTHLPPPPPEPPCYRDTDKLAPSFRWAIGLVTEALTAEGFHPCYRETWRSDERAAWLYGFGRAYDDGRGIVTNAPTAAETWHHYGLAADFGDERYDGGSEPPAFWDALALHARAAGLVWGGDFSSLPDRPHVQWGAPMRVSPSPRAAELLAAGGMAAVWREVEAL